MNTSYERELKSLIKELELEEAVRFSPPVPRTSLGELYRSCSVLVVPSLSEPQGLVVLEGMAAGCAIVASDTGGIGMMLDHGKSGLLFPASDVAALSRCLQQLLMDSDARQVLGATANRRFKTKFSREALAPHLLEAIAGTLRSTPIAAR
jgi:D-inositol-3-phosphate glycosyltransferase